MRHLIFGCFIATVLFGQVSFAAAPAPVRTPIDVSPLMKMSLDEVAAQVPLGSGFFFIGCPKCDGGSQEANVLRWQLGMGDTVRCRFCGTTYPNAQFPDDKEKRIASPDKKTVLVYKYYQGPTGRQYFYQAHAWFERTMWLRAGALTLATDFRNTRDPNSADRAATILARFAQVVPGYPVKFDFPFKQKLFYPADKLWPYGDFDSYRGSKFDWWGYHDIPSDLAQAFQMLDEGQYDFKRLGGRFGDDPRRLIVDGLFRTLVKFTAANPETAHNMSPRMYREMIITGRAIGEPAYVHDAVDRFRGLVAKRFFADGWWMEGAPSYHKQTVTNLEYAAEVARGYTDPPGWTGEKFANLDLMREVPLLARANKAMNEGVLPDGRMIPVNDTWWHGTLAPTSVSQSRLWPCMGQALLGAGSGATQTCLGLNWSGNYGHSHMDNGSIFLYAFGHELLPDIGYTHTRWRNYAVNSAGHNMVVVDEQSAAEKGPGKDSTAGNLLWFDAGDPRVKMIDLDARPAYPDATTYRRRLALVHAAEGFDYVVDRFDVEGGRIHDFFLHGSADQQGKLDVSLPMSAAVKTLVPSWGGRGRYVGEGDIDYVGKKFHVYDFLTDIASSKAEGVWTATWTYAGSALRAHMIPPTGSVAYRYRAPMIRQAGAIDADLPKYITTGIMQRHEGGPSAFEAVYEPFRDAPWIRSVKAEKGQIVVAYTLPGGRSVSDKIKIDDNGLSIVSSAGWKYETGKPVGGAVVALKAADLKLDKPAPKASAVRVRFGNRSFVFPVQSVQGDAVKLAMDSGIEMQSPESAAQVAFPHDKLSGPITWTMYEKGSDE
ncbi:MAG: heparinase II/III family protein [Candidatus Sumerlaeia bacterium]